MTVRNVGAFTELGCNKLNFITANTSLDEATVTVSIRQKTDDVQSFTAQITMARKDYADFLMQGLGTLYGQR